MKTLLFIAATFFLVTSSNAQSIEQIKAERQAYIWGEGNGTTLKKADQEALAMLINQVSAQVESSFELLKQEKGTEFTEQFNSVINTYSNATLKNTERIVVTNEPDAKVFRYIRRAEIDKIFADRRDKIIEFANNGQEAAARLQMADALRYYYWALTLLRSHPDGNSIRLGVQNPSKPLLATWLPLQMNTVFAGVDITMAKPSTVNGLTTVLLAVNYQGQPVQNLDYCYWDGRDWSNIVSAKDGNGYVEFIGTLTEIPELRLKLEYMFENEASVDNELRDVMQKLDAVPFRNSYVSFKPTVAQPTVSKQSVSSASAQPKSLSVTTPNILNSTKEVVAKHFTAVTDSLPYRQIMQKVVTALRNADYASIQGLFSTEGYQIYNKLIQYGQARLLGEPDLSFIQNSDGVVCRSLPMAFKFKNNNRQFVEDVVFHFNADKKIENLTFGLSQAALNDIVGKEVWDEKVRMVLINFLENYKTAYALKRADYIESLFADDALIITGSVLKVKPTAENRFKDNQIIKYNRYSKEEYVKKIKMSFAGNEFINIKFEDNTVRKSGKNGQIYGIQIKQDYFSSNYGDTGYLFLLVDLQDPNEPVIHVRTWQPKKNADGSIYGLNDF
jgi:hypothetical protein